MNVSPGSHTSNEDDYRGFLEVDVASPMPLTTVYITGPRGEYAMNVEAVSSHDAVRKAVAFFLDPFWKGPKPKAGTVLRLCPMGGKEILARVPARESQKSGNRMKA
jgi:hypothetical protein